MVSYPYDVDLLRGDVGAGDDGFVQSNLTGLHAGTSSTYTSTYTPVPSSMEDPHASTSTEKYITEMHDDDDASATRRKVRKCSRRHLVIGLCIFAVLLGGALGGALGATLSKKVKHSNVSSPPTTTSTTATSATQTTSAPATTTTASVVCPPSTPGCPSSDPSLPPRFPNGTVVHASSEHPPGTEPSYAAVLAIDGNPSTFWNDNTEAVQPDVLTVVSPVPIAFTGLALISVSDGWPTALYVETSIDGNSSWTKHATVTGNKFVNQTISFDETVVARGVRVTVTAVQDNGFGAFTRIAELKPIIAPWPVGTTVSASSFHPPGGEPSYAPSNAIDGDITTFWNDNDVNTWPDTLTITLPSTLSLSGVTLVSVADGPPTNFDILTSPDGITSWETHATITGNTAVQLDVLFDQQLVAAGAVRVTVTAAADIGWGAYSRIAELRPLVLVWPAGTTASGSTTAPPGGEPSYAASNAIDGKPATYWNDDTENSWPDVLTLSFPSSISISSITIVSDVNGVIEDFYVETEDSSGNWSKHATVAGNTAVQIPVWFDVAVACVGLRITVTAAQNGGFGVYTRIAEVIPGVNYLMST